MTPVEYAHAWFWAFVLTQTVEVPLYMRLARLRLSQAFLLSLVTHPVVWFVIPLLWYGAGGEYPGMIVVAELFAWLAEAAMLRRMGLNGWRAVLVSLAANVSSVAVGEVCRAWLGFP